MSLNILTQRLFEAYYNARKNKRNTANQLKFELNYEQNLLALAKDIYQRKYHLKPSIAFIVTKPVKREVFAASFRDRVVHHFISNCIFSAIDKQLINDSYSCRVGKGTGYGIKRAKAFLRKASHNYQKDAYILKLDIQGYFMSMQHQVLYTKVQTMLGDATMYNGIDRATIDYLLEKIIFADPSTNCRIKGHKKDWQGLPPSKSLFHTPANTGLPIGNLTSQIFGNVYLNDLDQYIKHNLKIKYYGRYVDDMIFMHQDKAYLKTIIPLVNAKLEEIGMIVHPKKIYLQHYTKGVLFLGQYIKPYRSYISKRVKGSFYKAIQWANNLFDQPQKLNWDLLEQIQAKINSYVGTCKQANTTRFLRKTIKQLSKNKDHYFDLDHYYLKFKPKEQIEWHFTAIYQSTSLHTTCL